MMHHLLTFINIFVAIMSSQLYVVHRTRLLFTFHPFKEITDFHKDKENTIKKEQSLFQIIKYLFIIKL